MAQNNTETIPACLSTHMCRYTSLFLQKVLARDHGIETRLSFGRPEQHLNGTPDGRIGIKDTHGNWHDHMWLVTDALLIDLTADQFGHESVILSTPQDQRYKAETNHISHADDFIKLHERVDAWLRAYYA